MDMEKLKKEQGKRLKKIISEIEGLTQTKLAEDFGLKHPAVNAYANGGNLIPNEKLYILITKYNVNLNWLIAGKGEMFIFEKSKDEEFDKKVEQKVTEILKKRGLE